MSTIRGRVIKTGGMVAEPAGFSTRTEGDVQAPITRPAYRGAGQVAQPVGVAGMGTAGVGGGHPFLDLSGVPFWRLVIVGAAVLWLGFVWISFRGGISGGVRV